MRFSFSNMKTHDGYTCFEYDIETNNQVKTLWFETEDENAQFFDSNSSDGLIVAFLHELMKTGEDYVSEMPISGVLYSNLQTVIREMADKSGGVLKPISIVCPHKSSSSSLGHTATGMSFGVDSLYTYISHKNGHNGAVPISLLTTYNHGSFNGMYTKDQEEQRDAFRRARDKARTLAREEKICFLSVDSNIDDILQAFNYTVTHTFRTAGITLFFSRLIGKFFYASGFDANSTIVDPLDDSAHYDYWSLPLLGNEAVSFSSDGAECKRPEKTSYISDNGIAQNFLNVCWRGLDNCSDCPKCVRTMTTLDVLGKLSCFSNVFDLEAYKKNYIWNWAKLISLKDSDSFYGEIYELSTEQHYKIGIPAHVLAFAFSISRRLFSSNLLHKIQNMVH